MAQHRPYFGRLSTSASTMTSVGQMPVIDEDEEARISSWTPTSAVPTPAKSYRRSVGKGLPPPYAPSMNSPLPPVYRPPYMDAAERKREADLEAGRMKTTGVSEPTRGRLRKRTGEKDTSSEHTRRSIRFIVFLTLLIAIVVGLAIGLTFGLQQKDEDNYTGPGLVSGFPVGSFSFNTTLESSKADCTSDPSTWRCYPYEEGSSAVFFWIIAAANSHSFTISSTDNPFAPSFSNLTLTLIDGNQPTERFVFSYSMNKTVVPGEAVTSDNRAARCSFDRTEFEATLWTRRRGNETAEAPQRLSEGKFAAWPGDVEISQVKKPGVGSQRCEDGQGAAITNISDGAGDCQCQYANFDLD